MTTHSEETRSLLEGAFFAALTVIITVIGLYMPVLFLITGMITPIPTAVMVYRHGLKKGVLSLTVAFMLLFILYADPITITVLLIQFGPIGLLFGLLFKNQVSSGKSIAAAAAVSALLTLVVIMLTSALTGVDLLSIENQLSEAFEESIQFYQRTGMFDDAAINEMKQSMKTTLHTLTVLLPGILAMSAMFSALITYFLTRAVLTRLKYSTPPMPVFSEWAFPWYTLWGVIVGLTLMLIGDRFGYSGFSIVGKNLLYILGICFSVIGLAVAVYYFKRLRLSKILKGIMVVLLILWPFTPFLLLIIGVLDPLIDFRRLNAKSLK